MEEKHVEICLKVDEVVGFQCKTSQMFEKPSLVFIRDRRFLQTVYIVITSV